MSKLFGFSLEDENKLPKDAVSPVPENNEDGVDYYLTSGFYGQYVDIEGVYRNEYDLIKRYREMALHPECDSAIENVVNEAIVSDLNDSPVEIELSNLNASDSLKKIIREEFKYIKDLLDFDKKAHEIFKNWYVDGRILYHKIIDPKNPSEGILDLRFMDALKTRFMRVQKEESDKVNLGANYLNKIDPNNPITFKQPIINEFFIYYPQGHIQKVGATNRGIKIAKDSVTFVTSGLVDRNRQLTLSYLHKAIKALNQLRMIEDALVIYRLSRAPERRIFYIDVGNLPKIKAEQYLRDVMHRYRNKLVYDANTGEVKDDKKFMCLDMNTKVPLLDGRALSITEISTEYKNKPLWTYSCNPETGKFVPGLITWAGVTIKNAKLMRITLDNGKTIDCTPEHKFPVWNKGLTEAKNLKENDSLIPLYRREKGIGNGALKDKKYEQIWLNDSKTWNFTHREVSNWKDLLSLDNEYVFNENYKEHEKKTIHHKNINRLDNTPDNLVRMNSKDHILYHQHSSSNSGKIGGKNCYKKGLGMYNKNNPEYKNWHIKAGKIGGKISSEGKKSQENFLKGRQIFANLLKDDDYHSNFIKKIKDGWTEDKKIIASNHAKRNELSKKGNDAKKELYKTEQQKIKHSKLYKVEYPDGIFEIVKKCLEDKLTVQETIYVLNNSDILDTWKILNKDKCLNKKQKTFDSFTKHDLRKITKKYTNKSYKQLKEEVIFKNHKIIKIEYLNERRDVGCLTIDGEELHHNYHTFALDAGVYTQNSMMEDFWLPRREGGRGTEITTLPGGQNLGELTDVQYFQKKLFRALNVPESRTASDGGFNLGRSSEILRDELMFGKFVGRLRKRFSNLFHDMLRTQLILKNIITPEDWDKMSDHIQYDYLYDGHFSELKDTELMNERLNLMVAVQPYIGRYYSQDYIRRKILRQTDQEIVDEDNLIKKEIEEGLYPDPKLMQNVDENGMPIDPLAAGNETLGINPKEPEIKGAESATTINSKAAEI